MTSETRQETTKEMTPRQKQELAGAESTRPGLVFTPAVDIFETEKEITLLADMPGVSNEGVHIHLEENQLTIRGEVAAESSGSGTPVYTEYRSGDYYRTFTLSNIINQSKIEASMKDGVLTVVLPKAEEAKPRQISVSAG